MSCSLGKMSCVRTRTPRCGNIPRRAASEVVAVRSVLMIRSRWGVVALAAVVVTSVLTGAAEAQRPLVRMRQGAVGPGGLVNLPYSVQDNKGTQWRVYQGGWIQQ